MSSLEQEMFLQWGNKKRMRRQEPPPTRTTPNTSRNSNLTLLLTRPSSFTPQDSPGSEGAILRSGPPPEKEKEERYYTTRGVVDTNGEESNGKGEESMWPKLFVTLSSKEKEEDFMAMKGCKPSHRPKKRAKLIQKSLLLVSPGHGWLICVRIDTMLRSRRALRRGEQED
ncbi:hypothetical protein HID58_069226 [Brassica napus]|uniref:Uncharacterized protein n=1 Tax=Brassica napus TaxID=3708 RepID=A0ABQ7XEU3_BRANA|nr:hypothetical protein HID58_069226 [Brassica napus]